MLHGLRSRHVITPEGEHEAVVSINGESIAGVIAPRNFRSGIPREDLGDTALLAGMHTRT